MEHEHTHIPTGGDCGHAACSNRNLHEFYCMLAAEAKHGHAG